MRDQMSGLSEASLQRIARDPREPGSRRTAAREALRKSTLAALAAARSAVNAGSGAVLKAVEGFSANYGRGGEAAARGRDSGEASGDGDTPVESVAIEPTRETSPGRSRPDAEIPSRAPIAISRSTRFADLGGEFEATFDACRIDPAKREAVDRIRRRLLERRATYAAIEAATGTPWEVVGLIHGLEAGFDAGRHLHNGDPLSARTVRVPAGRPAAGTPPFTWEESATDALRGHGLHKVGAWTLARRLFELERFNGFGYRRRGLPSPYLWSYSDRYVAGKYVRDGVFDATAVSRQAGAAVVLKAMVEAGDVPRF